MKKRRRVCIQCGKVEYVPAYGVDTKMGNFDIPLCYECRKKNAAEEKAEHEGTKKKKLVPSQVKQLDNQMNFFEEAAVT